MVLTPTPRHGGQAQIPNRLWYLANHRGRNCFKNKKWPYDWKDTEKQKWWSLGCTQWVLTTSPISLLISLYSFVIVVIKMLHNSIFSLKKEPVTTVLDFTDNSNILQVSSSFQDEQGKKYITLHPYHTFSRVEKKKSKEPILLYNGAYSTTIKKIIFWCFQMFTFYYFIWLKKRKHLTWISLSLFRKRVVNWGPFSIVGMCKCWHWIKKGG